MGKKSKKDFVLKDYPNALCVMRPWGKEYYQILNIDTILGQGKSQSNAWSAAYKNINS